MNINKYCNLLLRDVYSYDISACHYNILQKYGFDLSNLDKNDKQQRNIEIGKMMSKNSRITSLLRTTTESVINEYLSRNNILDDDVIVRQYDGVIVKRLLKNTDQFLPLEFKDNFAIFLISSDRQKYLATTGTKYVIKGVPHRYKEMDKIFEEILRINYGSKEGVFTELERIKQKILKSENAILYCIPSAEETFSIFLKGYGQTQISESLVRILDVSDIDREWYFNTYIRQFTESIVIEYLRGDER